MSRTWARRLAVTGFLCVTFAFYLWTAVSTGPFFQFGAPGYYNLLADAFLAGHVGLLVRPRPELLALDDPYRPEANGHFRLHDLSLYNGTYYLSWGPTPALVLFSPFKLVSGTYFPQYVGVAVFCFGGLVWSVALFAFLASAYFPATPWWMRFVVICSLGLSNVAPFLCRNPEVYQVAIASGYFFLWGSVYWLVTGAMSPHPSVGRLAAGSALLALAVGSRPHYVFAAVLLFILWLELVRAQRGGRVLEAGRESFALFAPFVVGMGLLGLYNYARFGSFTEFGTRYQLAGMYMPTYQFFDPDRILPGLYAYLLEPGEITATFPFFHLFRYSSEGIVGILPAIPFVNLLWLAPWLIARSTGEEDSYLALFVGLFMLLGLMFLVFLSAVFRPTMRYVVDFIGLLLMAAGLVWFWVDRAWAGRGALRLALRWIVVAAVIYGCLFNLGISITGYYDLFKQRNPVGYHRIARIFVPLERLLGGGL